MPTGNTKNATRTFQHIQMIPSNDQINYKMRIYTQNDLNNPLFATNFTPIQTPTNGRKFVSTNDVNTVNTVHQTRCL